jgi:tetratricopeptide (TPR) repeat protein
MSGRWKQWVCAGLLAGAVGCNSTKNNVTMPEATLPTSQGRSSMLSRVFGGDRFVPQAPPTAEPVMAKSRKKPGQAMEPETEVATAVLYRDAAFQEGKSDVERDQLLDACRQAYQRVLKADPKNKAAMVGLAEMYTMAGDKAQAMATYQVALHHNPKDHELAHQMARACAGFLEWQASADAARYALNLDPENRMYRKSLGMAQARMGQMQEAFETLLDARMTEAQARYILGRTLIDMDRAEEGLKQVRTAVAQDPQYAVAQMFLADYETGRATKDKDLTTVGHEEQPKGER